MGNLWDLWQEYENSTQMQQIDQQIQQTDSLDERVANLEDSLFATGELLRALIKTLESEHNKDFDGDGEIG